MKKQTSLTERDKRFIVEYMTDYNGTAAFLRCGFKAKNPRDAAYNITSKQVVKDAIKELQQKIQSEKIMDVLEAKIIVSEIARDDQNTKKDRLSAIDRLSKMSGWDTATKSDITSGGLPIVPTEIIFYSTEESGPIDQTKPNQDMQ